jgi:hypothetical protein
MEIGWLLGQGCLSRASIVAVKLFDLLWEWRDLVLREIRSDDLDNLLSAATKVSSKLRGPDGGEYRRWLRETVGSLQAQNQEVIEALHHFGVQLATTNYDGLIEEVTGSDSRIGRGRLLQTLTSAWPVLLRYGSHM